MRIRKAKVKKMVEFHPSTTVIPNDFPILKSLNGRSTIRFEQTLDRILFQCRGQPRKSGQQRLFETCSFELIFTLTTWSWAFISDSWSCACCFLFLIWVASRKFWRYSLIWEICQSSEVYINLCKLKIGSVLRHICTRHSKLNICDFTCHSNLVKSKEIFFFTKLVIKCSGNTME
jgi:hypothetical protein